MSQPLVSICVPNLNKRRFLPERMETLLAQTFTDWEMIVCDSYSDDGSWEFFQKFKSDPRIKLFQVPRAGLYAGWNECLSRVSGKYINIATSDDTASPDLLQNLVQSLEKGKSRIALCDYAEIDEHSRELPERDLPYRKFLGNWMNTACLRDGKTEFLLLTCFGAIWVTMAAVMFHRDLINDIGMFRLDRESFADFDWSLRASLASDVTYVPDKLTTFRIYGQQATPKTWTWRRYRLHHDAINTVLNDSSDKIPSHWKQAPVWREKILRSPNRAYLRSFDLYRWVARQSPRRFLRGVMGASHNAPGWLLQQTVRGFPFRWDADPIGDMELLLQEFSPSWPPKPLKP